MRRSLACLALGLVACGGGATRPVAPTVLAPPPKVVAGSLEAKPLLGDVPLRAAKQGAGALAIAASGPVAEGERLGAFVEVPKEMCLLVYARASASVEDLDLAAFADEGTPIAIDERPDPKPALLVCPPHPDRVYVAIHVASGSGLAVVGAQLVPPPRAAEVARAVGTRGTLAGPPRTPEAWPGLDVLVRAHRADLGGAWEEQRRVAVSVDPRAPSAVAFAIEEGSCTDALVVPDEDVALLEVEALDAEGRIVARARDAGVDKTITLCSEAAVSGSLRIRPHAGRGLVAVVSSKLSGKSGDLKSKPEVAWVTAATTIAEASAARRQLLARAGYGAAVATQSGKLELGRRIVTGLDVTSACTRIDVVGGAPLSEIEAAAWDDTGALLGEGEGGTSTTLFACKKGKARVDLGTRGRGGPFTLTARPERWNDAAFAKRPLAASRMLSRALGPGSVLEGTSAAVSTASLERDRLHAQVRTIAEGTCRLFAVGTEGEGGGVEVRVYDSATGDELDRSHGQHSGGVRVCADHEKQVRLEVRATAGRLEAVIGERVFPAS